MIKRRPADDFKESLLRDSKTESDINVSIKKEIKNNIQRKPVASSNSSKPKRRSNKNLVLHKHETTRFKPFRSLYNRKGKKARPLHYIRRKSLHKKQSQRRSSFRSF